MHREPRPSDRRRFPDRRRSRGRPWWLLGLVVAMPAAAAPPVRSDLQAVGPVAAAERLSPAIGLVTSRAPDVLRDQLGLDRGAGLVVESVAVGSPAERAGLKRHDVLVSLDDQLLVLPEQLATLVAASGAEARLVLDVRRAGRTLAIPLGGSPAPPTTTDAAVPTLPAAVAVAAPPAAPPASLPAAAGAIPMAAAAAPAAPVVPAPPKPPVDFVPPPGARRLGPNAVVIENRDYWLKVYRDSETCLMVRDARGWLLFNGPIVTPQQRSLIPRRVRDRVVQLEAMLDAVAVQTAPPAPTTPVEAPPGAPAVATPRATASAPPTAPSAAPATAPSEPVAEIGSLDIAPIEIR